MGIKYVEFKKIMTSPVILALLGLFIGFNILIIFSHHSYKKELVILNQLVEKFGYEITPEMITNYDEYHLRKLNKLNEITSQKTGKTFKSAVDFFKSRKGDKEEIFTEKELEIFTEIALIENYRNVMNTIDDEYDIDLAKTAESNIKMYGIKGKAAETVRKQYDYLSSRLEELKKNGEHKSLFFYGKVYKMHSFLYKNLIGGIIFQILILVVLSTSYLVNFEFENKTHFNIYSTKRGRKLMIDKLIVALVCSIIFTTILLGITLAVYFSTYSYEGLWNVPISSAFNTEYMYKYISWWNLSFKNYLLCVIALVYICQLLFVGITFVISSFIRNSYIVFFVFLILFGTFLSITMLVPLDTNATFISRFTPFMMILNPFTWFMGVGAFTMFKYYELNTVVIWSIILIIICTYCMRLFKRQDIY